MHKILVKINSKNKYYRMLLLFISLLLSAVIYNMFMLPLNIMLGGTSGIAQITKFAFNIDPAFMVLILSLICTAISILLLDFDKTASTLVTTFLYPFLVKITEPLATLIPVQPNDMFIVVVLSGVVLGIANGLMYKSGYSNGGLTVITQSLDKYYKISVAKSGFFINGAVIITGMFFFGATNTLYAVLCLYIRSIITDKVILGISSNKAFYIITSEEEKVKDFVIDDLGHNATIFDVKGAFLEKKRHVILTVVPTREYFKVTEGIKSIDEDAFFVVTDSYQVVGGK